MADGLYIGIVGVECKRPVIGRMAPPAQARLAQPRARRMAGDWQIAGGAMLNPALARRATYWVTSGENSPRSRQTILRRSRCAICLSLSGMGA